MKLDEAINHCIERVEELEIRARSDCMRYAYTEKEIKECADEYKQLADWLKALKEIWDCGSCNDCRNGQCEWKPKLGQLVRYNCPYYVGIANEEVNADVY